MKHAWLLILILILSCNPRLSQEEAEHQLKEAIAVSFYTIYNPDFHEAITLEDNEITIQELPLNALYQDSIFSSVSGSVRIDDDKLTSDLYFSVDEQISNVYFESIELELQKKTFQLDFQINGNLYSTTVGTE